jgi:PIN domain nuclease of toxin-antitoxin system
MQYLIDTVTIARHFTGKGKVGRAAAHILNSIENSNNLLVISVVSLMEIMYLAEARRINLNLSNTLSRIEESSGYRIV